MHGRCYVLWPKKRARTPSSVIRQVREFLDEAGFVVRSDVWGDGVDYYKIGGRWSDTFALLRLRHQYPAEFTAWWTEYMSIWMISTRKSRSLFRTHFPSRKVKYPLADDELSLGDDKRGIELLDDILFAQLEKGFGALDLGAWEIDNPNVILTGDLMSPVSMEEAIGKYWVAVIDYHY